MLGLKLQMLQRGPWEPASLHKNILRISSSFEPKRKRPQECGRWYCAKQTQIMSSQCIENNKDQ